MVTGEWLRRSQAQNVIYDFILFRWLPTFTSLSHFSHAPNSILGFKLHSIIVHFIGYQIIPLDS